MKRNTKPNVIIIYADDLGYGDLSCYGAEDIHTPNVDRLVESGVKFIDGYSTSAVCTPARYSLLTGEYPFRNPDAHILPGDAPCIIDKAKNTLPKVFRQAGYKTAIVGKWHLGLGDGNIDWNKEIDHTPNDIGFDYSYIFPATNDRVPCVYMENSKVVGLDENDPISVSYEEECPFPDIVTGTKNPELLRMDYSHRHNQSIINGVGRLGYMRGGEKAVWKDEDLAEAFLEKSKAFIDENKDKPFFLFHALHQPHVPRLPNPRFVGSTKLGPRGDVIVEMDWCIGEITQHLAARGLLEDTIIIFSSDNGPVLDDGYKDDAESLNGQHLPAGPLRGGKYSKFEGGARVPFIISWKGNIKPQTSQALLSQVDFMSSFAKMLDIKLGDNDAPDSQDVLAAMLGDTQEGREEVLYENLDKGAALRQGKWTYLQPNPGDQVNLETKTELGNSLDHQLYNMNYDIGQRKNVAQMYPHIVEKMNNKINEIKRS